MIQLTAEYFARVALRASSSLCPGSTVISAHRERLLLPRESSGWISSAATMEVPIRVSFGYDAVAVHKEPRREKARRHVEQHAVGAVAPAVGPATPIAATTVEDTLATIILSCVATSNATPATIPGKVRGCYWLRRILLGMARNWHFRFDGKFGLNFGFCFGRNRNRTQTYSKILVLAKISL